MLAETLAESRFTSIVWSNYGEDDEFPLGLIAAGMFDGSLSLWDPHTIIQLYKNRNQQEIEINQGCIALQQVGKEPIKALEFNPFKPNLLASGGE